MEAVEEVVVVIDGQIRRPSPGLDDGLDLLDHVGVGVARQLGQLPPVKQRHKELTQRVLNTGCVIYIDHPSILRSFLQPINQSILMPELHLCLV